MCGGAILADFIPPTVPGRPKKLTAEYLWPELKRSSNQKYSKPIVDDDFEADFQGFKDDEEESDIDADLMMADIKPFTFSAGLKSHGSTAVKHVEATAVKLSPGSSSMKGGKIVWSDGKHNVTSPIVVTMHARL